MSWGNQDEIYDRLDELGEYETLSSFAYAYYCMIADYMVGESRAVQGLRLRMMEFLESIGRYHRALAVFASEDQVTLGNVRSAVEKRDSSLRVLLEQLEVDEVHGAAEIARLLLAAECCYQLAVVDRVVEKLEAAVEAGADGPLVQFALGYNRYELATRAFTRYREQSNTREVVDEDRYTLACLSAVSAFQDGLMGEPFDAQLHWWIGIVLEGAGFPEAARRSFEKAEEMARQAGSLVADEELALEMGLESNRDCGYHVYSEANPITEDEVRKVGWLLQRTYSQSDILEG